MAVQIIGGERKRQDAPPVEPDAGKAGRAVEQSRVEMERWCTEQIRQHGRCKDRWTKRGGELGLFQISKIVKTTLTYAKLVRLNSPTG